MQTRTSRNDVWFLYITNSTQELRKARQTSRGGQAVVQGRYERGGFAQCSGPDLSLRARAPEFSAPGSIDSADNRDRWVERWVRNEADN